MSTLQKAPSAQPLRKANLEEYDPVVLEGGSGGTIAARTFAKQGQRVAVIERNYVGGSGPNMACLLSKNTNHSAKVVSYLRRSEDSGVAKSERLQMTTR